LFQNRPPYEDKITPDGFSWFGRRRRRFGRKGRQAGFAGYVTFIAPENFRDAKQDAMDSERGRDAILAQLKEHLVTTAAQYLAPANGWKSR